MLTLIGERRELEIAETGVGAADRRKRRRIEYKNVRRTMSDGLRLLEAARELLPRAVAPYSKFRVAAALEDEDGDVHPGVNVESVSLGLTICAERNALFGALARGATRFRRIAVAADRARPVLPCGACRQVLLEHAPDLLLVARGARRRRRGDPAPRTPAAPVPLLEKPLLTCPPAPGGEGSPMRRSSGPSGTAAP